VVALHDDVFRTFLGRFCLDTSIVSNCVNVEQSKSLEARCSHFSENIAG